MQQAAPVTRIKTSLFSSLKFILFIQCRKQMHQSVSQRQMYCRVCIHRQDDYTCAGFASKPFTKTDICKHKQAERHKSVQINKTRLKQKFKHSESDKNGGGVNTIKTQRIWLFSYILNISTDCLMASGRLLQS